MPEGDHESASETVVVPYPFSLYLHVGAVAVWGARAEGALVRLLRHLEPSRLSQPHSEVTWDATERAIRNALSGLNPALAAEVEEVLDWAAAHDLRRRRNQAVHDQYPVIAGDGAVWATRLTKRRPGEVVVAPYSEFYSRLNETSRLLLTFASELEDITFRAWGPGKRLPAAGPAPGVG